MNISERALIKVKVHKQNRDVVGWESLKRRCSYYKEKPVRKTFTCIIIVHLCKDIFPSCNFKCVTHNVKYTKKEQSSKLIVNWPKLKLQATNSLVQLLNQNTFKTTCFWDYDRNKHTVILGILMLSNMQNKQWNELKPAETKLPSFPVFWPEDTYQTWPSLSPLEKVELSCCRSHRVWLREKVRKRGRYEH